MKVIIDIPDNIYEWVMNTGKFGNYRFDTTKAIKNGTSLDDVKAEIQDIYVGYRHGYEIMADVLQILDNIGKGDSK